MMLEWLVKRVLMRGAKELLSEGEYTHLQMRLWHMRFQEIQDRWPEICAAVSERFDAVKDTLTADVAPEALVAQVYPSGHIEQFPALFQYLQSYQSPSMPFPDATLSDAVPMDTLGGGDPGILGVADPATGVMDADLAGAVADPGILSAAADGLGDAAAEGWGGLIELIFG